jgi:hypothetical protein
MRFILVFIFLLISALPTHAYLDPGTGSMAVQIIAATVFGGIFFIKAFWKKVVHFYKLFSVIGKE